MSKRRKRRKGGEPQQPVAEEATEAPPPEKPELAILEQTLIQRGAVRLSDGTLQGGEIWIGAHGHVVGRLMLEGIITPRQYGAAQKLERVWRRWAALAGIPPHVITERNRGRSQDPTQDDWTKAKTAYLSALVALRDCNMPREIFIFVEILVMDDEVPPGLKGRKWPSFVVDELRAALSRLVKHFEDPANF